MTTLGVLLPLRRDRPAPPPDALPLGRAALALAAQGVEVVFGDRAQGGALDGMAVRPGPRPGTSARWAPVTQPVDAVYDRFRCQTYPEAYAGLRALDCPVWSNPPEAIALCRDKVACQRALEAAGLALPPVETDPTRFAEALHAWGAGFLKPRFGAYGRGVRRVVPGDALPARGEGAVRGVEEPLVLQRAVAPPAGWAGVCVRVLVQRAADGRGWTAWPGVARRSREDPVVNVHRGAEPAAADDVLDPAQRRELAELAAQVADALAAHLPDGRGRDLIELGLDAVLGRDGALHLIEVNSRPRGRLDRLAAADPARYAAAHRAASLRPLEVLAERVDRM